ncbi:MAG: hypothetical protein DHS20C15_03420 [Planctomycetota bacterium]|nr:MAG: hypothetical protein DHS20C15_03420 [Planctomycetota bacterium]
MPANWPEALACENVAWLPTEASGRRFARLTAPKHHALDSAVLMTFPRGTPPEEVQRVQEATRALADLGIPVPECYAATPGERWILQEDLGDVSLALARQQARPLAELYSEAVALLAQLGDRPLHSSPQPPLDARRLRKELDHFARHTMGLPEGPGAGLAADFDALVTRCTALPLVLCHRDYHSRNLMLHAGRVRVIDHQDAMLGPAPYDRVSLAYDPYVELPDAVRDRIAGGAEGTGAVAVQRLVKACGTFGEKGEGWTKYLTPAAAQARRLIKRDALGLPMLDIALQSLGFREASA